MKLGENINAAPIEVWHSKLLRATNDSTFRSLCPVCKKGLLLVARSQRTFKLMRDDRCNFCGQPVRYMDGSISDQVFEV